MGPEKFKEIREWGTFILSAVTVIAIPVGFLILRNQRLEIMQDVENRYLQLSTYKEDSARWGANYGEIKGQLNAVLMEQVHINDSISTMKEQMAERQAK